MLTNLSQYGAVSAKAHAILGNRLRREDFSRIFDMQTVGEVAAFLKGHPNWASGLSAIEPDKTRRIEIEAALRAHVLSQYLNLFHYVSRKDAPLLRYPVLRAEMEEIMTFLRLASAGKGEQYTFSLPEHFDRYSRINYQELSRAVTYDDMLEAVRKTGFYQVLLRLRGEDGAFPPFVFVERAMNSYYFRSMFKLIEENTGGDTRDILRNFIGMQVDMINATSVVRILRSFPALLPDILSYQLSVTYKLKPAFLRKLSGAQDLDGAVALMRTSDYGKYFTNNTFDSFSDYFLEMAYENYRKHLWGIPSVHTAVAFISLRETELQNIISAIESVRYNVSAEKAWSHVVGMRT